MKGMVWDDENKVYVLCDTEEAIKEARARAIEYIKNEGDMILPSLFSCDEADYSVSSDKHRLA